MGRLLELDLLLNAAAQLAGGRPLLGLGLGPEPADPLVLLTTTADGNLALAAMDASLDNTVVTLQRVHVEKLRDAMSAWLAGEE